MNLDIRRAKTEDEARELTRVARRCFHIVLRLLVTKPKWAYGAWDGERCLGGVFLKESAGVGIIEWIFVAKEARGLGLAKRLTAVALREFERRGLTRWAASVRDDNTASWSLFAARGFRSVSMAEATRLLGPIAAIRVAVVATQAVGIGFDLWLGSKTPAAGYAVGHPADHAADNTVDDAADSAVPALSTLETTAPGTWASSVVFHLGIHGLFVLFGVLRFGMAAGPGVLGMAAVLLVRLLFSYAAARAAGLSGRLRVPRGGWLVALVVAPLGGTLFYPAFWHPRVARWREPDHRAALGLSALFGAIGVMALRIAASLAVGLQAVGSAPVLAGTASAVGYFSFYVLLFDMNPLFEAYAGPRILRWNKWIYGAALLATAATLVFM